MSYRKSSALWRRSLSLLLRTVRRAARSATESVEQAEAALERRADEQQECREAGREVSRSAFYRMAAPLDDMVDRLERLWGSNNSEH
ncbi:MAG: hypothetical protein H0T73_06165 [Ardenticatenales bacterium]|nr:hypothetical protein [Ardenticatenales bacterium]